VGKNQMRCWEHMKHRWELKDGWVKAFDEECAMQGQGWGVNRKSRGVVLGLEWSCVSTVVTIVSTQA